MENEENEDLLIDVSEESDSAPSDYCIQEKAVRLFEADPNKAKKSWKEGWTLIAACFLLFLSATVVLITLPVYIEESSRCGIKAYSKIATLTTIHFILFTAFFVLKKLSKKCTRFLKPTNRLYMCLPSVLKTSFLLSLGSLSVFWLANEKFISCHLQDPLKGCVVVFSLIFYFVFSKRKTSVERVFCTITVIVGTFVTVDFGLCNRYRCRGADLPDAHSTQLSLHPVYVIAYILSLAVYALHFVKLENCCRSSSYSSSLDVSIVSSESSRERLASPLPINQSLSIISGGRCPREELNVTLPKSRGKFPVTSTPNEVNDCWVWDGYDWLAAHHFSMWILVVMFCWLPSITYHVKEPRLVAVLEDLATSFACHVGFGCSSLWLPSSLLLASYAVVCGSSLHVLLATRSSLTVVCVLMNALPMAGLFWSVYQLDTSAYDLVTFNLSVTGEAVSAMLGFPIIGIGTFLILKSHIAQNMVHLRIQ